MTISATYEIEAPMIVAMAKPGNNNPAAAVAPANVKAPTMSLQRPFQSLL